MALKLECKSTTSARARQPEGCHWHAFPRPRNAPDPPARRGSESCHPASSCGVVAPPLWPLDAPVAALPLWVLSKRGSTTQLQNYGNGISLQAWHEQSEENRSFFLGQADANATKHPENLSTSQAVLCLRTCQGLPQVSVVHVTLAALAAQILLE